MWVVSYPVRLGLFAGMVSMLGACVMNRFAVGHACYWGHAGCMFEAMLGAHSHACLAHVIGHFWLFAVNVQR